MDDVQDILKRATTPDFNDLWRAYFKLIVAIRAHQADGDDDKLYRAGDEETRWVDF